MNQPLPPTPTSPARPSLPPWALLGVVPTAWLAAFVFAAPLGRTTIIIGAAMHLAGGLSLAIVLGTFVVAAVVGLAAGALLGRLWPNAVAIAGAALLVVGQPLSAFAPDGVVMGAGRAIGGLGAGAAIGVAAMMIIRVDPARRTMLALVGGGVAVVAAVVGVFVGGVLAMNLSFRIVFMLTTVLALAAAAAVVAIAIVRSVRRGAPPHPAAPVAGATR